MSSSLNKAPVAVCECPTPQNDWEVYVANSEILRDTYQCVSDETLNNVFHHMGYHEKEFAGL